MTDALTFYDRMSMASDHERAVEARLRAAGMVTTRFDCFNADPAFSAALRRTRSLIRWQPDIAAIDEHDVLGLGKTLVVECKSSTERHKDSSNYCIEADSVHNLARHYYFEGLTPVIVWHDFRVTTLAELAEAKLYDLKPPRGTGSGTDAYLVVKAELPRRFLSDAWHRNLFEAS